MIEETQEKTQEKTETKTETTPDKETGTEKVESPLSPIEKMDAAIKRGDAVADKIEALVKRQEEVAARMMLGGRAEAGSNTTPEDAKEAEVEKAVKENIEKYV